MKVSEAFPSNYLKAADVEKDTTYTIRLVQMEDLGEDHKPVAYFNEVDKGLVLNKTNATTIQELHGSEMNDWTGKKVTLFATEVAYQGKQTMAIRVRLKPAVEVVTDQPDEEAWDKWFALTDKANIVGVDVVEPPDGTTLAGLHKLYAQLRRKVEAVETELASGGQAE